MERSNLPEDLIEEILSRVPAKPLARWRSASKRWNARLKSDIFAKMQSSNAPNESSLIITLMDFRVYLVKPNLHGIHNNVAPSVTVASQFYLEDPKFKSSQVDICNVFHCDGLFLCTTKDNRLVVWNPCSGETKWIKPRTHYKKSDCYALGYHNKSSSKQYKILRVFHQGGFYYEIYDFNTDSWRVFRTDHDMSKILIGKCCGSCVSVKGNTYWLVGYTKWTSCKMLLSFDFSTERFQRLTHPYRFPSSVETLSVVGEDQLCLCGAYSTSLHALVTTISAGSVMSWRKLLEVNASGIIDHDFSNGVSLLTNEQNNPVFCFNNYIPVDIPHGGNFTCKSSCPLLLNYVPSLTRIQQGTRAL